MLLYVILAGTSRRVARLSKSEHINNAMCGEVATVAVTKLDFRTVGICLFHFYHVAKCGNACRGPLQLSHTRFLITSGLLNYLTPFDERATQRTVLDESRWQRARGKGGRFAFTDIIK